MYYMVYAWCRLSTIHFNPFEPQRSLTGAVMNYKAIVCKQCHKLESAFSYRETEINSS